MPARVPPLPIFTRSTTLPTSQLERKVIDLQTSNTWALTRIVYMSTHLQGTARRNVAIMTYKLDNLFWAARSERIQKMKYTLPFRFFSSLFTTRIHNNEILQARPIIHIVRYIDTWNWLASDAGAPFDHQLPAWLARHFVRGHSLQFIS